MRYFIEIAYNGKNYFGWQIQPEQISVQETVEKALSTLLRDDIKIMGAGRTDAGVHAKQLFAHFDANPIHNPSDLVFRLNSFLPNDIAIRSIKPVTEEAHARFDASKREYEYYIVLHKDPFWEGLAYQLYRTPDMRKMNEAAKSLLDYEDFQCFSRSNTDVKTYTCKVTKAEWRREGERLIFHIEADRFLRNMVRAIVGTLLDVGYGKTTMPQFHEILKSKDRGLAGASAPAHGLYLTRVHYPEDLFR
ncbi:tRNA pseudouridine(38-40) synthase TruA [Flavobacteriaceae bacterium TK19130]|nr:tRNA pseudouridine(38-40) synthase TruA [Thermobacterium salinum]